MDRWIQLDVYEGDEEATSHFSSLIAADLFKWTLIFFSESLIPYMSAQIIQRQLEQVEEKQRQLEERGVAVEKALRGEAGNNLFSFHIHIFL